MKKENKKSPKVKVEKKALKEKKKSNKENYVVGLKKEMKQVKWPTFKEIVKYTIATIIFCIILIIFFELIKVLMAYIRGVVN